MKKLIIILFLVALYVPAPASAGVLRALGHTGVSIVRGTGHFGKCLGKDVARDFYQWIF